MGESKGSTRRPRRVAAALTGALVIALLAHPLTAAALSIIVPADVTGPTDVSVRLEAGEGPGVVTLRDGAAAIGSTSTVDGVALFSGVSFAVGSHSLRAVLAGGSGESRTSPVALLYSWGAPAAPRWVAPPKASRVVSPVALKAQAGSSTATLTLSVNGVEVRSIRCTPGKTVAFGKVRLRKGANALSVTATSLTGATSTVTRYAVRYEWPHSTCIVVDKSDYRLYWVKGQQLIASYKVAHGRHNWTPCRTWKILAKYRTDPRSVYGPRKMRMFKRVGSPGHYRYVYTRYAIHGTNEPSSIGHQASHGCIRMYSKDVLTLWPQVPIGTFVVTRP